MEIDTNKLANLLKDRKLDEAKKLLNDFIKSPMTDQEKAGVIVQQTFNHMTVMNSLNEEYIKSTEALLAELKELNRLESKSKDDEALKKVREGLK